MRYVFNIFMIVFFVICYIIHVTCAIRQFGDNQIQKKKPSFSEEVLFRVFGNFFQCFLS